jgi:hypothetical protein
MAAAKTEVVSNLEINSIEEMFRGISPMLLVIYNAGPLLNPQRLYSGTCEIQNGGENRK